MGPIGVCVCVCVCGDWIALSLSLLCPAPEQSSVLEHERSFGQSKANKKASLFVCVWRSPIFCFEFGTWFLRPGRMKMKFQEDSVHLETDWSDDDRGNLETGEEATGEALLEKLFVTLNDRVEARAALRELRDELRKERVDHFERVEVVKVAHERDHLVAQSKGLLVHRLERLHQAGHGLLRVLLRLSERLAGHLVRLTELQIQNVVFPRLLEFHLGKSTQKDVPKEQLVAHDGLLSEDQTQWEGHIKLEHQRLVAVEFVLLHRCVLHRIHTCSTLRLIQSVGGAVDKVSSLFARFSAVDVELLAKANLERRKIS